MIYLTHSKGDGSGDAAISAGDLAAAIAAELDVGMAPGNGSPGRPVSRSALATPGIELAIGEPMALSGAVVGLDHRALKFLAGAGAGGGKAALEAVGVPDASCIVVSAEDRSPRWLDGYCAAHKLPLLRVKCDYSTLKSMVSSILDIRLSASASVHGVLVEVLGIGILITGKSGIGKSECALDLVVRGHKLVADDVVNVRPVAGRNLQGFNSEIIRHHLEIQGLGIVNVREMFGVTSVRRQKKIDLLVELVEWNENAQYDRLGIDEKTRTVLGVEVPMLVIPVRPGRNVATIIEVAARNHMLKLTGIHSAREFQRHLSEQIAGAGPAAQGRKP
jgi:HPr kinase/phosphorylase